MILQAIQVRLIAAYRAQAVTKYDNTWYKSPLKKTNFDAWYRGVQAMTLLLHAGPAMIAATDKWFDENNMTEGAICGRIKRS